MHRAAMTEVRLVNWLKSGRGQGFGKDYHPFLQITRQDHASHGHSHIIPNQFIGRQHHLLSTLERKAGILNLAQPVVKDFREQYPQWPCFHESPLASLYGHLGLDWSGAHPANSEGTLAIAKSMSVRHASFVGLQIPYAYSTDQLLTLQIKGGCCMHQIPFGTSAQESSGKDVSKTPLGTRVLAPAGYPLAAGDRA